LRAPDGLSLAPRFPFLGEGDVSADAPGGDPRVGARDFRVLWPTFLYVLEEPTFCSLDVFGVGVLFNDNGRGLDPLWMFCICARGNFLIWDVGLAVDGVLPGVVALTLRFPGAVIAPDSERPPSFRGVMGVPSLVVGRPEADVGRAGGGIEVSPLKKVDCRLGLLPAGDDCTRDRLSMVRSARDGRALLSAGLATSSLGAVSFSRVYSGSPSRKPAREEDAERNAFNSPNSSSS
jgi:hypothetical protein